MSTAAPFNPIIASLLSSYICSRVSLLDSPLILSQQTLSFTVSIVSNARALSKVISSLQICYCRISQFWVLQWFWVIRLRVIFRYFIYLSLCSRCRQRPDFICNLLLCLCRRRFRCCRCCSRFNFICNSLFYTYRCLSLRFKRSLYRFLICRSKRYLYRCSSRRSGRFSYCSSSRWSSRYFCRRPPWHYSRRFRRKLYRCAHILFPLCAPIDTTVAASAVHDSRILVTSFVSRNQLNAINASTPDKSNQSSSSAGDF